MLQAFLELQEIMENPVQKVLEVTQESQDQLANQVLLVIKDPKVNQVIMVHLEEPDILERKEREVRQVLRYSLP